MADMYILYASEERSKERQNEQSVCLRKGLQAVVQAALTTCLPQAGYYRLLVKAVCYDPVRSCPHQPSSACRYNWDASFYSCSRYMSSVVAAVKYSLQTNICRCSRHIPSGRHPMKSGAEHSWYVQTARQCGPFAEVCKSLILYLF